VTPRRLTRSRLNAELDLAPEVVAARVALLRFDRFVRGESILVAGMRERNA